MLQTVVDVIVKLAVHTSKVNYAPPACQPTKIQILAENKLILLNHFRFCKDHTHKPRAVFQMADGCNEVLVDGGL